VKVEHRSVRQAHRRARPEGREQDASARVDGAGQARHALGLRTLGWRKRCKPERIPEQPGAGRRGGERQGHLAAAPPARLQAEADGALARGDQLLDHDARGGQRQRGGEGLSPEQPELRLLKGRDAGPRRREVGRDRDAAARRQEAADLVLGEPRVEAGRWRWSAPHENPTCAASARAASTTSAASCAMRGAPS
jgi:hypothetical protein